MSIICACKSCSGESDTNEYVDESTLKERDRIIKLIEFPNGWHETVYVAGEGDEHFVDSCCTCMNIALIKGENK